MLQFFGGVNLRPLPVPTHSVKIVEENHFLCFGSGNHTIELPMKNYKHVFIGCSLPSGSLLLLQDLIAQT